MSAPTEFRYMCGRCGTRRARLDQDCPGCVKPRVPKLRGYTSAERKQMPVHTIIAEYFPDAIAAVSRHSLKANDKHNPGQPMGWSRDKSTDHLNCAGRHLMTPRAVDPDTGEEELVGATWRCLAALQLREEARLAAAGIMPLSGKTPDSEPPSA